LRCCRAIPLSEHRPHAAITSSQSSRASVIFSLACNQGSGVAATTDRLGKSIACVPQRFAVDTEQPEITFGSAARRERVRCPAVTGGLASNTSRFMHPSLQLCPPLAVPVTIREFVLLLASHRHPASRHYYEVNSSLRRASPSWPRGGRDTHDSGRRHSALRELAFARAAPSHDQIGRGTRATVAEGRRSAPTRASGR
jgi:hypothetical protein